ncbi:LysM peptidoglycan-binding domain-containing protein [Crenothrix polyspora]|uniref:Peptidoglycan-binding lysin domain protein n=1 Tax=Crenothrix polyspora TaxID=360316 RepID=A0A1R4HBU9_9GAMM|nr:LysM peptidoglycan-binding domain-containing protein [Crenothrix polyspora]SJM93656.1 Peptidoglycan-binding lysin domain protein [Crenothrix polyspora]
MAFPPWIKFITPLLLSMSVWAEDIQLNPDHPNQYTVVEGDTLWAISGRFLQRPSQWPKLWHDNSQIHNPHLIYPGDTLYLTVVNGRPQLSFSQNSLQDQSNQNNLGASVDDGDCLQHEDISTGRTNYARAVDKLSPCMHITDMKQAINIIAIDEIDQFLTSPRVVSATELKNAPYIIDFGGEHLIASTDNTVYVRGLVQPKTMTYTIYRPGEPYIRPGTQEILGYEAKYIGNASLKEEGNPATLTITKANSEIRIGDRIMANIEENVSLNYFPRPPDSKINASIINVLGGVSQIGRYNVVVIDKGSNDGVLPGYELDIYKNGRVTRDAYSTIKNDEVKLPDEFAGTLMVFRPFERLSYALVMKATQSIHVLDKVQTP